MTQLRYIEAKSILSKLKVKDYFLGVSYNMNLYRGCQHGCIYCDTRSECYGIGDISKIAVKKNALELLSVELKAKKKRATVGTGSMNDPYMPIEKELQLTRNALKILEDYKYPVHIITKSDLIIRDMDILEELSKIYLAVSLTITTANDELSKKIEPNAPKTSDRFKAINLLAKQGIYTGVTMMPILPFINDTSKNIGHIIQRAFDNGASYILPMFGVTLRKGSRDYFYQNLNQTFPQLKERYTAHFGSTYICNSFNFQEMYTTFNNLTQQYGLDSKMKFYKPELYNQKTLF